MSPLTFGKHKSKTIEELYASDPGYCRWLLSQKILIDSNPAIGGFLKEKFANDDGSFLMTFGKHKRKTLKQIYAFDCGYIEWLKKNEFVSEKMHKLKEALNEFA